MSQGRHDLIWRRLGLSEIDADGLAHPTPCDPAGDTGGVTPLGHLVPETVGCEWFAELGDQERVRPDLGALDGKTSSG